MEGLRVEVSYIYISGPGHWWDRSDLEDAIEDWLAGRAEVCGGGSGKDGWDIDLEVPGVAVPEEFVQELLAFLRAHGPSPEVRVRVVEHRRREYRL
jgi:hypothetical protein